MMPQPQREDTPDTRYMLLAIHSSMRNGNTYALAQGIIRRLSKKPDVKITEVSVAELNLPFCLSCHLRFQWGEKLCLPYGIIPEYWATRAETF